MVFARAKLLIEDKCFEEEPGAINLKFSGVDVTSFYKYAYELIKAVFDVPDSDIQETAFDWGKKDTGDEYKVRWFLHKDMDLFTYLYIRFEITAKGGKNGTASMAVRPLMRTEYPQDTVWQRSLFYEMLRTFWHRVFYAKRREDFFEECRHSSILYQKRVQAYLEKMRSKAAGSEEGH